MSAPRKICVFSGKRGGFGAYLRVMQIIGTDPALRLQLLLSDMHAVDKFGRTADEVRRYAPDAEIELVDMGSGRDDTPRGRAENLGTCLNKVATVLDRIRPDIMLVHADRGEHLMVAFAALNLGIPVAHTQGGEVSGNIDDVQRHAISKVAHLHFPETEVAAARLRALGEEPWRIEVVGSPYIDRIVGRLYTAPAEARQKYGIAPDERYALVIVHPETEESGPTNYAYAKAVLQAVKASGLKAIVTYPCSDPGYDSVIRAIEEEQAAGGLSVFRNIDNLDFLGLMAGASVMVGNSSSALVEAPYFQLPAVNIGKRQNGRDREPNVVTAEPTTEAVGRTTEHVLSDPAFRVELSGCGRRLGDGHASERIVARLKDVVIDRRLLQKRLVS